MTIACRFDRESRSKEVDDDLSNPKMQFSPTVVDRLQLCQISSNHNFIGIITYVSQLDSLTGKSNQQLRKTRPSASRPHWVVEGDCGI